MNNGDMPAVPVSVTMGPSGDFLTSDDYGVGMGLTKREHFAVELYAGMISACDTSGEWTGTNCADEAVKQADALLKALENKNAS